MRKNTQPIDFCKTTKSQQIANLALDADIDHFEASRAREQSTQDQKPQAAASSSSCEPPAEPMHSRQVVERYERIGRHRTAQLKHLPNAKRLKADQDRAADLEAAAVLNLGPDSTSKALAANPSLTQEQIEAHGKDANRPLH